MLKQVANHIRGNAVGYLALFVALGVSAAAATKLVLPPDSVGTPQLRNGAVTGQKVARSTLTGANVAHNTLTGANVAHNTLTGANIALSTLGTVPDAARLGGQLPSAFQSRLTGTCSGGAAVASIAQDGSVGCAPAPMTPAYLEAHTASLQGLAADSSPSFDVTDASAGFTLSAQTTAVVPADGVYEVNLTLTPAGASTFDLEINGTVVQTVPAAANSSTTATRLLSLHEAIPSRWSSVTPTALSA